MNYIRIDTKMINELKLQGAELLIYAYIHSFTQNNKDCYTTQCSMARLFNVNRVTVKRALISLDQQGCITVNKSNDRIIYKANFIFNSSDYFDVSKDMIKPGLNANDIIVYGYISKNLNSNISDVAEALKLCRNTVSAIMHRLSELGLFIIDKCRSMLGRFKGTFCRLQSYFAHDNKCNTHVNSCNTHDQKCNTYNINYNFNNKYYGKKANRFNDFTQNDYDFEALEQALICN